MLANRVRVVAIYPEDRILDAIADAVRTNILGQLHYPVQSERAQRSVVEPRGPGHVSNPNSGVVYHHRSPWIRFLTGTATGRFRLEYGLAGRREGLDLVPRRRFVRQ
jgi:hypothetical protein